MPTSKQIFIFFILFLSIYSTALTPSQGAENKQNPCPSILTPTRDNLSQRSANNSEPIVNEKAGTEKTASFVVILESSSGSSRVQPYDEGATELLIDCSHLPPEHPPNIEYTTFSSAQRISFTVWVLGNYFQLSLVGETGKLPDIRFTNAVDELTSSKRKKLDLISLSNPHNINRRPLDILLSKLHSRKIRQTDTQNNNENSGPSHRDLGLAVGIPLILTSIITGELFWLIGSLNSENHPTFATEFTPRNILRVFSYFLSLGLTAAQDFLIFIIYYAIKRKQLDWQWIPNNCC